ncbi:MAG TPA: hypothetical protein VF669_01745 [Tepidisphaeraceae bacterium]|jgi:hypothetical protein
MIRFRCLCSQLFEVADDRAGSGFQCPACGRLVEVPTLSELTAISDDGTYKVDVEPEDRPIDEQLDRVNQLKRVFTRHRIDEFGREIDLRTTLDEVKDAGTDEIPLELADEVKPAAPKYDPITGELIRPLDIKDDRTETSKGLWVGPPVQYGRFEKLPFTASQIIPELFRLPNLAVMFAVLLIHFVIQLMLFPITLKFLILVPFLIALLFGLVSHYTNIVEEVGPSGSDELPRPLRNLEWIDDLWGPFSRFMLALLLAYGIGFTAFYLPEKAQPYFALATDIFGAMIFPALLLTTATSGSILNLRPDRVLRVIKAMGFSYVVIMIGWFILSKAYLITILATGLSFLHLFDRDQQFPYDWYLNGIYTYPALITVVFLLHALMWYLGLQYRFHHAEFPWVLQVHERDPSMPPRRGFEVQKRGRTPKPVAIEPIAAQPVIPIEDRSPQETQAQIEARRRRMLNQTPQPRHGHPARPVQPLQPPDDHFDIDELLKP